MQRANRHTLSWRQQTPLTRRCKIVYVAAMGQPRDFRGFVDSSEHLRIQQESEREADEHRETAMAVAP